MSAAGRASVHLIGGGWEPALAGAIYGPFLQAAAASGHSSDGSPEIACLVLDEGDGREQFGRWAAALLAVADCRPRPVLVELGGRLDAGGLANADGLLVCGGLTPAYAAAVAPAGRAIRSWLTAGHRPYAGFSAGSAVASERALVGGWRSDRVPVCPEDASEDLDEITLAAGIGLVPFVVDVHCAQWGTLSRLIQTVSSRTGAVGVGVDENTVLTVPADGGPGLVGGAGQVWRVAHTGSGAKVTAFRAGQHVPLG